MKLSKREKILIYLLCAVVVTAGMVLLVIQPAMKRGDTLDQTMIDRQSTEDNMRMLIAQTDSMREQIVSDEERITQAQTHFLPPMNNNDLDRYITGLLQKYGLVAQSLEISDATDQQALQTETAAICAYEIHVQAAGTVTQFVNLTDAVNGMDGIRIGSFVLQQQTTPVPTATPKPTKTPKTTRTPRATRTPVGMTPTPVVSTTPEPTPTPYEPQYAADIGFVLMTYDASLVSTTPEPAEETAAQ